MKNLETKVELTQTILGQIAACYILQARYKNNLRNEWFQTYDDFNKNIDEFLKQLESMIEDENKHKKHLGKQELIKLSLHTNANEEEIFINLIPLVELENSGKEIG